MRKVKTNTHSYDALTVNDLMQACINEVRKGHGNRVIYISADDEGNEFHELFFLFTSNEEDLCIMDEDGLLGDHSGLELKDMIILG